MKMNEEGRLMHGLLLLCGKTGSWLQRIQATSLHASDVQATRISAETDRFNRSRGATAWSLGGILFRRKKVYA